MLKDAHAYTKLPASDPLRARQFYVERLGFTPEWEYQGHIWLRHADGSSILVFPSSGKAAEDHDQCGWVVDEIAAEVVELRREGSSLRSSGCRLSTASPWMLFKAAWFRDSERHAPDRVLMAAQSQRPGSGAQGRGD
jgi:hypothetical protein